MGQTKVKMVHYRGEKGSNKGEPIFELIVFVLNLSYKENEIVGYV